VLDIDHRNSNNYSLKTSSGMLIKSSFCQQIILLNWINELLNQLLPFTKHRNQINVVLKTMV